ncbi:hypothetical protein CPB85DRAFT_1431412 [Mucidula mucida]|nr:hypothetical protein CPB85DRAFT_1431412 [Mucidula mucida]
MLSSRSLALRKQLPSLIRHQSTKIPRWRQFSEDVRDAERRGTLRAPPPHHPYPPLWRCKELGIFYQRGIVETWRKFQTSPGLYSEKHYMDSKQTAHAMGELVKLAFCPLLPFAPFVPNIIFPISCILPAQMDRYAQEALRVPPPADIIAAREMLAKIGGLDFSRMDDEPEMEEFWEQHSVTLLTLWHLFPMPPSIFRKPAFITHLDSMAAEDRLLRQRDLATLEMWEVKASLGERGMYFPDMTEKNQRALLHWWVHESGSDLDKPEKMVEKVLGLHVYFIA